MKKNKNIEEIIKMFTELSGISDETLVHIQLFDEYKKNYQTEKTKNNWILLNAAFDKMHETITHEKERGVLSGKTVDMLFTMLMRDIDKL